MPTCTGCGTANPDGFRLCGVCGAALSTATIEHRKPTTLLFCDLCDSTALAERFDAEAARSIILEYFRVVRDSIERHGGTVEKFIGDAVLAVFGVPVTHEDDALRACRAALEMKSGMGKLNVDLHKRFGIRLALRIGVNTGEVLVGDSTTRESFVSGDAVNTAARLEQHASRDGILLGYLTYQLVRDSVVVVAEEPFEAKGKAEAVSAYRLVSLTDGRVTSQRRQVAFVGRTSELSTLGRLFRKGAAEKRCILATVLGEPGIGKSRLVGEVTAQFAMHASVLRGRCLSYGQGITFWPLREMLFRAVDIRDEDSREGARDKLARRFDPAVAARISSLLGFGGEPLSTEEVQWAVRRSLEALASDRPLVCVVEDVHWAEATLLDLLEHLADRAMAPLLLLCTSRPELAEMRQEWPITIRLNPLEQDEQLALAKELGLDERERPLVLARAGGNPLFCEELTALRREDQSAAMPASLSALLTARLDRLPVGAREVAERGSVEGEVFHLGAVSALTGRDVRADIDALVSSELVLTTHPGLGDEAAFRFKHALVRDAAYAGLTKRLRAALHENFADWLEAKAGERASEYDEILGYHLEQACRYAVELAPRDVRARSLGVRAAKRLTNAAERRVDIRAATALLERAHSLLEPGDPDLARVLLLLGRAFDEIGDVVQANDALDRAIALAEAGVDDRLEHRARLRLASMHARSDQAAVEELRSSAEVATPVLKRLRDERGLAECHTNLWLYHCWQGCRFDTAGKEARRELDYARRARDRSAEAVALSHIVQSAFWGCTPVVRGIKVARACRDRVDPTEEQSALIMVALGVLLAMAGNFEEARVTVRDARNLCAELGFRSHEASLSLEAGMVERLAGDAIRAEAVLRAGYSTSVVDIGDRSRGIPIVIELGKTLCDLERYQEAVDLVTSWEPSCAGIDRAHLRAVRGRALGRLGSLDESAELIADALHLWEGAEELNYRAQMLVDLAKTYRSGNRLQEAWAAGHRALAMNNRKGNIVSASRTKKFLDEVATMRRAIAKS
jgi:class 3 adenylate cyclase/tetratricopeptide (TPR) repeat protein